MPGPAGRQRLVAKEELLGQRRQPHRRRRRRGQRLHAADDDEGVDVLALHLHFPLFQREVLRQLFV